MSMKSWSWSNSCNFCFLTNEDKNVTLLEYLKTCMLIYTCDSRTQRKGPVDYMFQAGLCCIMGPWFLFMCVYVCVSLRAHVCAFRWVPWTQIYMPVCIYMNAQGRHWVFFFLYHSALFPWDSISTWAYSLSYQPCQLACRSSCRRTVTSAFG